MKSVLTGILITALLPLPVMAQEMTGAAVEADLEIRELVTIVDEEGREVVSEIAPDSVVPSDTILVRATLENTSDAPVSELSFSLPVDAALIIDTASVVSDVNVDYAFATRQAPDLYAAMPELTVTGESGEAQPATAADIGSVEFTLSGIDPAKNITIEYTATVR